MTLLALLQAIPLLTKAAAGLGEIVAGAMSDDPAEPLNPLTPLDFEADKKLKESLQALDGARDLLSNPSEPDGD